MDFEKIIFDTIDEFNKSQNQFEIEKNINFSLIGGSSPLDSLALVNYLTRLEKNLYKKLNREFDIINGIFKIKKNNVAISDLIKFLKDNIK